MVILPACNILFGSVRSRQLILNAELKTDVIELDLSNQANGTYFNRKGSVTKNVIHFGFLKSIDFQ